MPMLGVELRPRISVLALTSWSPDSRANFHVTLDTVSLRRTTVSEPILCTPATGVNFNVYIWHWFSPADNNTEFVWGACVSQVNFDVHASSRIPPVYKTLGVNFKYLDLQVNRFTNHWGRISHTNNNFDSQLIYSSIANKLFDKIPE